MPKTQEEGVQNLMKRVKVNDPAAIRLMGKKRDDEQCYEKAFEYWKKAAELGDMMAHYNLSIMYHKGEGVEKDMKRAIHHLEVAAIGGHAIARFNLGCIESENGKMNRAIKHWIIAAKLGEDDAFEAVKDCFEEGVASKEDFEAALRGHQAAVDATKSKQREEAYAFYNMQEHNRA